jgi:2-oxoglutarate dehydrogenase E2 component (dihydrolipoamide succinyltransferase)
MATEVVMPQMGESIAEGTIAKWLVKVGERVERDQPLLEISTDKVDAEIPSPATGTLLEIRSREGETVAVNAVIALIGEQGEKAEGTGKAPAPQAAEKPASSTGVEDRPAAPAAAAASPAAAAATRQAAAPGSLEERVRQFSSPLVRSIAKAEGVDLSQIEGSGIHGRVTKKDILAYLGRRKAAPVAPPAAAGPAAGRPLPPGFHVPAYQAGESVTIEPMSKIRQLTAAHMVYSKAVSAHVSTVFHIDMSKVHRARERAKTGFARANATKLSYMPFVFKAVAAALRRHRKLNAAIDGTNVVYKNDVNLGMAVALDWGLIVPVIKRADQLSLAGLAKAANDLAERARGKKLKPEEVQGGSFTITNPGVFGSLFGTPIINQPQVAILGIGTIEKRPVVTTDEDGFDAIAIKVMAYFAITYDHRLVDGADADHFMNDVKAMLEKESWAELEPYV